LQLCTLLRFKRRGFPTYCVIGGGTGLIGDPSGRSTERTLVDNADALTSNMTEIVRIVRRVMNEHADQAMLSYDEKADTLINDTRWRDTASHAVDTRVVDNAQWLCALRAVDFLRDVGKHFSVSNMLGKDSVKSRLQSNNGISYTEFSYQLLQAYDFYVLHREHDVCVQIGGSDQWGNIVAGTEYVRRTSSASGDASKRRAIGVTVPLMLTSDGIKIGKSSGNTPVWLSAHLTSPFEFYQYFVQLSDATALRLLPQLSLLDARSLNAITEMHTREPDKAHVQRLLAMCLTRLVHGARVALACERATTLLFGSKSHATPVSRETLAGVADALMPVNIARTRALRLALPDLLVEIGACASRTMARKLIESGGCSVNERKQTSTTYKLTDEDMIDGAMCILRVGKRHPMVLRSE